MSEPFPLDVLYPVVLELQAHIKQEIGRHPFTPRPTVTPRAQALSATAEQLGLGAEPAGLDLWLAAVEIGGPESVVTLIALADGGTRLCFDERGGTIRPDEAPHVAQATQRLLAIAAASMAAFTPVGADAPQPRPGRVAFSVRTGQGVFGGEAAANELAPGHDPLSALYQAALAVLAAIRGDVG